jgi:hypothetical protein
MASEPSPRALPGKESPAPALSGQESPAPTLSFWLQLMLAEIAARREALESARAEEARRRAERAAESADSRGSAHRR